MTDNSSAPKSKNASNTAPAQPVGRRLGNNFLDTSLSWQCRLTEEQQRLQPINLPTSTLFSPFKLVQRFPLRTGLFNKHAKAAHGSGGWSIRQPGFVTPQI
jgi:hypothetical protein